jgi:serine/threonine protein kinase
MTPAAQRCVGGQIATGMTYLHSLGIVHSDLKAGAYTRPLLSST